MSNTPGRSGAGQSEVKLPPLAWLIRCSPCPEAQK